MARVTNVPDDHHVVRHCKNRLIIRESDEIKGVFPEAFHLRPATQSRRQETYLSAIYYEHFAAQGRMKACCAALPLTPKDKDGLMRLSVKGIKEQGARKSITIRVTHEPTKTCAAYSAIRGLPIDNDDELAGLLATLALIETVQVSSVRDTSEGAGC
jgi:hypothetical protein